MRRFTRKRVDNIYSSAVQEIPYDNFQPLARKSRSRELTTFNIVLLLVVSAVVITAYISNIVKVDTLMMEITTGEKEEQNLLEERETLRAEINMLSSYSRIQQISATELGLINATQQPYSLTVYGLVENNSQQK